MAVNDEARILTCVYCGHEYPLGTPSWGNEVLTEHIRTCAAHPMRAVVQENERLRAEVVRLRVERDAVAEELLEYAAEAIAETDTLVNGLRKVLAVRSQDEAIVRAVRSCGLSWAAIETADELLSKPEPLEAPEHEECDCEYCCRWTKGYLVSPRQRDLLGTIATALRTGGET